MKVMNQDVTDGSFSTKNKRILESHQKNHKIINEVLKRRFSEQNRELVQARRLITDLRRSNTELNSLQTKVYNKF